MADIDWSNPIHYNDGEYPCMIVKAYDQSDAFYDGDVSIIAFIHTPKGRWMAPMVITANLLSDPRWKMHVYMWAVDNYKSKTA